MRDRAASLRVVNSGEPFREISTFAAVTISWGNLKFSCEIDVSDTQICAGYSSQSVRKTMRDLELGSDRDLSGTIDVAPETAHIDRRQTLRKRRVPVVTGRAYVMELRLYDNPAAVVDKSPEAVYSYRVKLRGHGSGSSRETEKYDYKESLERPHRIGPSLYFFVAITSKYSLLTLVVPSVAELFFSHRASVSLLNAS